MSKLNLVAPQGRLLLKEITPEEKTSGGVILPSTNSDPENRARMGKVVSNGILVESGHRNKLYKEGTLIYFGKFSGAVVVSDEGKFISITEGEIVALSQ